MSIPISDVPRLWAMKRDEFNEWRAVNDIPRLLDFFKSVLPHFAEWQRAFGISDTDFCRVVPTSDLFIGSDTKLFVEESFSGDQFKFFGTAVGRDEGSRRRLEIHPYFAWAKKTLGRKRFFPESPNSAGMTDRLRYSAWNAPINFPAAGQATMQGAFEVLKLGGILLPNGVDIGGRNLAFANLDFLSVEGEFHGSIRLKIGLSSCKHMRLNNARLAFWNFSDCELEEFTCENSELYDFQFIRCRGFRQRIADTNLRLVTFKESILPDLSRCDLTDFKFVPSKDTTSNDVAGAYRRIRAAYQQLGKRREASEAYYLERTYERRGFFGYYKELRNSPPQSRPRCPPIRSGTTFRQLLDTLDRKTLSKKELVGRIRDIAIFHIRIWLPPYLIQTTRAKLRWLSSMIENIVWGYGERPMRIVFSAAVIISAYAMFYLRHAQDIHWENGAPDLLNALYFSTMTFTTLGYGDVVPMVAQMKIACSTEALLGAFFIGLVVAGFSNRSKY